MERVVEIRPGRVAGVEQDGVCAFLGIPYAAPPVGPGRWCPPAAPDPWVGVRPCHELGPIAPQTRVSGALAMAGEPDAQSEDCLTVNVWTPGVDGGRRPVMVWIHGGGFTGGSGAGNLYRGAVLAGAHDVVVVTINYRLGALGFLAHPLLAEVSQGRLWAGGRPWRGFGNWGLADQVAALAWVRDNIVELGGDPGNVTVFGESAGGMSISALLGSEDARPLLHRAVVQSGPPYTHDAEEGAGVARELAGILGVELSRPALERVPAGTLVEATTELAAARRSRLGGGVSLPFLPTIDGGMLERAPEEDVARGGARDIPLLIGTNRDETAFFAAGDPAVRGIDDEGLARWAARVAPADPSGLVHGYREVRAERGDPVTPLDLWVAISSDIMFRRPSLRFATAHRASVTGEHAAASVGGAGAGAGNGAGAEPGAGNGAGSGNGAGTFAYLFTVASPAFGGALGSCHALEIPFVFGLVGDPVVQRFTGGGEEVSLLSGRMQEAWTSFARTGAPRVGADPEWAVWDGTTRRTMVLGPWPPRRGVTHVVNGPRQEELAILDRALEPATRPPAGA